MKPHFLALPQIRNLISTFYLQALQQELSAREQTVAAMKASGNLPPVQLEELCQLWESVNHLSDVREAKLKESLQLVGLICLDLHYSKNSNFNDFFILMVVI